jgi:hypothetical protein
VSNPRLDILGAQRRLYNPITTLFSRQCHKILQQLQANFPAFLRVKLRGENVVASDWL